MQMFGMMRMSGCLIQLFLNDTCFRHMSLSVISNDEHKGATKTAGLGSGAYVPIAQNTGTFSAAGATGDIDLFTRLARGYVFRGFERRKICEINAQVGSS
jgi:hypothetical protein